MNRPFKLIAAVAQNGVIGYKRKLPWQIDEDIQYFLKTTKDKVVIAGVNTNKYLPDSTKKNFDEILVPYVESGIQNLLDDYGDLDEEVFVIGGGKTYSDFLPYCNTMLITEIGMPYIGDTYFPKFNLGEWNKTIIEEHKFFNFVEYKIKV